MYKKSFAILSFGLIALALTIECKAEEAAIMRISSPAFEPNTFIPVQFSCQGKGVNPPLIIEGAPGETKSLALIVDDPDAPGGDFVHWVVYNAPVINRVEENEVFGKPGINSLGKLGYVGPCPPSGTHRYFFKIYALDTLLNLNAGINKADLESAMAGHILDQAQLVGLYQKQQQ